MSWGWEGKSFCLCRWFCAMRPGVCKGTLSLRLHLCRGRTGAPSVCCDRKRLTCLRNLKHVRGTGTGGGSFMPSFWAWLSGYGFTSAILWHHKNTLCAWLSSFQRLLLPILVCDEYAEILNVFIELKCWSISSGFILKSPKPRNSI